MPNINLNPELHRKLGRYGNRDESWNVVVKRVLKHLDEESALDDKLNRRTVDGDSFDLQEEDRPLLKLENGTKLRHRYQRGDYRGESVEAEVQSGKVNYEGESLSPSGAATKADKSVRAGDATSTHNGWTWWEYEARDDEWKQLDELR